MDTYSHIIEGMQAMLWRYWTKCCRQGLQKITSPNCRQLFEQLALVAEVAQVVEQRTENPRVTSSILVLGTTKPVLGGSSSVVERLLAKEEVASSNLVFRSSRSGGIGRRDSLKNCWGATPMSVRPRPSAPSSPTPGTLEAAIHR